MYQSLRLIAACCCVILTLSSSPSTAIAQDRLTETTTVKNGVVTGITYSTSYGSQYDPEPGLASLLKGRADQVKAASAWLSAQAKAAAAIGQANQTNAQALQSLENARTEAIAGNGKAAANFYEGRKLYENYRDLAAGPSQPKKASAGGGQTAVAPGDEPVEARSGQVRWPVALLHSDLLEPRLELETLFAVRSRDGSRVSREVRAAVEKMRGQLRGLVGQFPPSQYAAAKRFLDALLLEGQRAPALPGMAVR